jgi:hypothetical protein
VITEFSAGISPGSYPEGITTGPDYNIWFTEEQGNRIGRLILDPAAVTGMASSIGTTSASLAGTVTPFGSQTSYVFQYGRTSAYGSVTNAETLQPGGKPVAVSTHIVGLQPGTLYHYRLTASSTNTGGDRTFTTKSPPPPPPPALRLKASKPTISKAVAGKAFSVSITVTNANTGKGVKGRVFCTGKLAGKPLPASRHSSTTSGKTSCTWQLPKTAHGKHFTGTIALTYKNVKVTRSFSAKAV